MIKSIAAVVALASLALCLAAPVWYFLGEYSLDSYKTIFLFASVIWFVSATLYDARRQHQKRAAA